MRIAHAGKDFLETKAHVTHVEFYPYMIRPSIVTESIDAFSFEVKGEEKNELLSLLDEANNILVSGNFVKEDRAGYPIEIAGNVQESFFFEF